MKKIYSILIVSVLSITMWAMDAAMYQWRSHFSYGTTQCVVEGKDCVYGLAGGALFSVDKYTEEITTYSKQNGLNGGDIAQIEYDATTQTLIIAYVDGLIDLMKDNNFFAMTDLQQKSLTASKKSNRIVTDNGLAYFCMPFGIMVVDIQRRQIKDTYYIGEDGKEVDVIGVALCQDSIFAISANTLFSIGKNDYKMDYHNWHRTTVASDSSYQAIAVWKNDLFVVAKSTLAQRKGSTWYLPKQELKCTGLRLSNDQLFLLTQINGIFSLRDDLSIDTIASPYVALDIANRSTTNWIATENNGIVKQTPYDIQEFTVNGPLVNIPYRMRFAGDKMIMVPGGYYVSATYQPGSVMLYENDVWSGYTQWQLIAIAQKGKALNLCDAIIDPNDHSHYFACSLGAGIWEFRNNQPYTWYYSENSGLDKITNPAEEYTWVDGFAFDSKGNLWMINIADIRNIKVLTPEGTWISIDHTAANQMQRARDLLIWNQNENIKIFSVNHTQPGLVLLNDNGTISNQYDDQCIYITEFKDQDNQRVTMEDLYSIAQDKNGALWIGTNAGLVVIDDPSSLFTSNTCRKIKIPRDDGTGLADYLLGTEQINAIAVDGANRKWIGTAASGLYLVSEDGLETIYHFTSDNSPLVDNAIISLAIQPTTGRVFVGTGKGLMSYQNDAAPASEDYSSVYAYPNPVRPDFEGVITIRGLMDETVVHITDNAGNLVCETRSNGGLAIWDGKTADGRRAASGVYTVFLNENTGSSHAVTKILLMH